MRFTDLSWQYFVFSISQRLESRWTSHKTSVENKIFFKQPWSQVMIQKTQRSPFAKHSASGGVSRALLQEGLPLVIWLDFFASKNQLEDHWNSLKTIFYDRMPDEKNVCTNMLWRWGPLTCWTTKQRVLFNRTFPRQVGIQPDECHRATSKAPIPKQNHLRWSSRVNKRHVYIYNIYISVYSCIWVARESLQLDLTFGGWRY